MLGIDRRAFIANMVPQSENPADYPTVAELIERVATRSCRAATGALLYPARGQDTSTYWRPCLTNRH